jgi:hypothetical protein
MSKVAITGNASGTGTFTIASPNSNTDRTLNLPDNSGTLLSSVSAVTRSQLPAGSVLQVVQVVNTTDTRITSLVDFLTASITPSSSSNKILVMGNLAAVARRAGTSSEGLFSLFRGATNLGIFDGITPWNDGATNNRSVGSVSVNYLDSPNTTSSISYILKLECAQNGVDINDEGGISSLTLMEISA